MNKEDTKNLKKRYLIWLYKTTKEALDRIERKFTQLTIDKYMLSEFKRQDRHEQLKYYIDEFEAYIRSKEKEGLSLKYQHGKLRNDFLFLELKLSIIEKTIIKELGKFSLRQIKSLYEQEMTERILKSTEHK